MSAIHVPKRIIIHCTASKDGVKYPLEQIRKDHIARGFEDVGYHIVIQPDGQCDHGRPLNRVGAHVEGMNTGSIGIALVGHDKFTRQQFDTLRYNIDGLLLRYMDIKKTEIYCHSQFESAIKQGKTCPNIPINVLLCWYYQIVGEQAIAPYLLKKE
jgi:hypothetical protein